MSTQLLLLLLSFMAAISLALIVVLYELRAARKALREIDRLLRNQTAADDGGI